MSGGVTRALFEEPPQRMGLFLFREVFQILKHLPCMGFRFDGSVDLAQVPGGVNQEGLAFRDPQKRACVLPDGDFLGIGKQGEVQPVFVKEAAVAAHAVRVDPDGQGVEGIELREAFSKSPDLGGSAGSVVLGVEEQQHPLPPVIGKGAVHTVLIRQSEVRGRLVEGQLRVHFLTTATGSIRDAVVE